MTHLYKMEHYNLNIWAILTAASSNFLVGGLWYSPLLFGKVWMKVNGFTEESMRNRRMGRIFGLTFLFSIIMATNLSLVLGGNAGPGYGAAYGLHAGLFWVAMAICIIGLFEGRSLRYLLIHAGYVTISFLLMGLIIASWK